MEAAVERTAVVVEDHFAKLPHGLMDAVKRGVLSRDHAYVYSVVYRRRTYGTGACRTRLCLLAEDAACSVRQLRRYLTDLVAHGFLAVELRRGQSNFYAFVELGGSRLEALPGPRTPVSAVAPTQTPTPTPTQATGVRTTQDMGVRTPRTPVSAPVNQESSIKSSDQEPSATRTETGARSSPPDQRRTRLTKHFIPTPKLRAYAQARGLSDPEIDHLTEEFSTYWIGDGRPKANWPKTWQNRVCVVADRAHKPTPARPSEVNRLLDPAFSPDEARLAVDWTQYGPDGFDAQGLDPYGYDRDGWGPGGRAAGYSAYSGAEARA